MLLFQDSSYIGEQGGRVQWIRKDGIFLAGRISHISERKMPGQTNHTGFLQLFFICFSLLIDNYS